MTHSNNSGDFDPAKVQAALEGRLSTDDLTPTETEAWLEGFGKKMRTPGKAEEAFFADRRKRGVGVGLSEDGRLVRESDRNK